MRCPARFLTMMGEVYVCNGTHPKPGVHTANNGASWAADQQGAYVAGERRPALGGLAFGQGV